MAKKIMLTMADELYNSIEKKRAEHGFMTTQEIINDILRRTLMPMPRTPAEKQISKDGSKKSKAGRPKKSDEPFLDYFSRKK